jgi:predicted transcriptional regulator
MTKLLHHAIERLRLLPDDMQDIAARVLIAQLEEEPEPGDLEAIKEGREDFARGDFVTLDEWRDEMGLGDR